MPVEEFIALFCQKLMMLVRHDFTARMQAQCLQEVKSSLDEHEFHVVGDFAENYAFVVQDASQSFHWNNALQAPLAILIVMKP